MGFLVKFEPVLCTPLCLTSIMILSVSLEMVHVILTDPGLAPSPGAGSAGRGLEPEPWGTPRAADGLDQTLGTRRIAHLAFLAFVLGNVVSNLCMFVRRNPSIRGVFLAGQAVGQGWSYCYVCESHVPQRCGHCHDCKACVLRRDHHCVLFGQCVGHANHRYYLCCLAHLWLGLLHAITLNADLFLGLHNQGLSLHNLLLLFIPWALFFTGQVGLSTFAVAFVADTCLLGFLLVSAFLVFHLQLLRRGLTTREWSVGSGSSGGSYDLGWRENVVQLLGHRWYLTWLCPLLPSTLPGDGITFRLRPLPPQPPGYVY